MNFQHRQVTWRVRTDCVSVSGVSRTKIAEVTLNALRTRQSLVKGERLVRHEMRAVLSDLVADFRSRRCNVGSAGGPIDLTYTLDFYNHRIIATRTAEAAYRSADWLDCYYPKGFATLSRGAMPEATSGLGRSKLRTPVPQRKIDVKRELSVDSVSVFTLIRTDTTLDHSQKAEKV